eukprot:GEMP01001017.1.p1 GENE.GEMP01001017.1~~GEMP01001017.1.p1  ORF type:complete len:1714 (+),score=558.18 GEMP01001017.1:42-5183(+)
MDWGSSLSTFTSKAAKIAKDAAHEANKAVVDATKAQVGKKQDLYVDYVWQEGQTLEFEVKGLSVAASKCSTVFSGDALESINDVPADRENIRTLLGGPKPLHFRLRHLTPQEMGELNEKFISRMGLAKNKITSLELENKELKAQVQPGAEPGLAHDPNTETRSSDLATTNASLAAAHEEAEQLRAHIAQLQASPPTSDSSAAQLAALQAEIAGTREGWAVALGEVEALKAQLADRESAVAEVEAMKQQLAEVQERQSEGIAPSEVDELQTQVSALKSQLSMAQTAPEELATAQQELAALKMEHSGQDESLAAMQQQIANAKSELSAAQQEADALKQQLAAAREGQDAGVAATQAQIDAQLAAAETTREELAAAQQELAALKTERSGQDESLTAMQQQVASSNSELAGAQQEADVLKQQLAAVQEGQDEGTAAARAEVAELRAKLATAQTTDEELAAAQQELATLQTTHVELDESLTAAQREADVLKQQLAAAQEGQDEGLTAAQAEVAELRVKLATAHAAHESLASAQSQIDALNAQLTIAQTAQEQLIAAQQELATLKAERVGEDDNLATMQQQVATANNGLQVAQREMDVLKQQLDAVQKGQDEDLAASQAETQALKRQLALTQDEAQNILSVTQSEVESLKQQLVAAHEGQTDVLTSAQSDIVSLKQQLAAAQIWQNDLATAQEKVATLQTNLATAQQAAEQHKLEAESTRELQQVIDQTTTEVNTLHAQVEDANASLTAAQQEVTTLQVQVGSIGGNTADLEKELAEKTEALSAARSEVIMLKHTLSTTAENEMPPDLKALREEAQRAEELQAGLDLATQEVIALQTTVEEKEASLTAAQQEVATLHAQVDNAAGQPTTAEFDRLKSELVERSEAVSAAQSEIMALKHAADTETPSDLGTLRKEAQRAEVLQANLDSARQEVKALNAQLYAKNADLLIANEEIVALHEEIDADVLSITGGGEESKSLPGKKTVLGSMFRRLAPKIPLSPLGGVTGAHLSEQLASAHAEISSLKKQLQNALGEIDSDWMSSGDEEAATNALPPGEFRRPITSRAKRKTPKERLADALKDIASLKEELAQLQGDPAVANAPTRVELQMRYETSLEHAKSAHEEEMRVQREQLQDAYEKIVQLTDAQAHGSEEELDAVQAELEGLKGNQAAFEAARAVAEKQAEAFEADLNAANTARRQLQEKQAETENVVEQLRAELEDVTKTKETIKARAKEMKASFEQRVNEMSQEKESLVKEKEALLKDLETNSPDRVVELSALLAQKELNHTELVEKTRQEIALMKKENTTMQQVSQWEVNNAQSDLEQMRADLEEGRRQLTEAEDILKVEREQAAVTLKAHAAAEEAHAKIEAEAQSLRAENAVNSAQLRQIRDEHLQGQRITATLTQERNSLQVALKEQQHQQELLHSESRGQIDKLLSQIATLQKEYQAVKVESERTVNQSMKLNRRVSDLEERRQSVMTKNSEMRTRLTQYQQMSESDALKRAMDLEDQVTKLSASLSDEQIAHNNSRTALACQLGDLQKQLNAALAIKEGAESEPDENSADELFDFLQESTSTPIGGNAGGTGGAVYGQVNTTDDIDLEEGCTITKGGVTNRALVRKVAKLQEKLNRRPIVCHFSDAPRTDVPLFFKNLPLVKAAERPLLRLTATMNRSKSCMWIFFVHVAILYLYILFRRSACSVPRLMQDEVHTFSLLVSFCSCWRASSS